MRRRGESPHSSRRESPKAEKGKRVDSPKAGGRSWADDSPEEPGRSWADESPSPKREGFGRRDSSPREERRRWADDSPSPPRSWREERGGREEKRQASPKSWRERSGVTPPRCLDRWDSEKEKQKDYENNVRTRLLILLFRSWRDSKDVPDVRNSRFVTGSSPHAAFFLFLCFSTS